MTAGDALELAAHRTKLAHQQILKVVGDLDDDQLAWRPVPRAHSIGWTLWHLVRSADAYWASLPSDQPRRQLWEREALAAKWDCDERILGSNGLGTGVDDDLAASLRPPSKADLLDYAKRTFAAVDADIDRLDQDLWCREHTSTFFDGPATIGRSLMAKLGHDHRHLGEMEYVKGLMGLRGSVTR